MLQLETRLAMPQTDADQVGVGVFCGQDGSFLKLHTLSYFLT